MEEQNFEHSTFVSSVIELGQHEVKKRWSEYWSLRYLTILAAFDEANHFLFIFTNCEINVSQRENSKLY